jgi:hypothetical protein
MLPVGVRRFIYPIILAVCGRGCFPCPEPTEYGSSSLIGPLGNHECVKWSMGCKTAADWHPKVARPSVKSTAESNRRGSRVNAGDLDLRGCVIAAVALASRQNGMSATSVSRPLRYPSTYFASAYAHGCRGKLFESVGYDWSGNRTG